MARNEHSGYPLKWFKDQNAARHAYECAFCLEILKDPVQVRDCGHQFCALCIDDIMKTDPRCPLCRIQLSDAMIFEDHAARRLIKQMSVNCCNPGCSWVGCLSSLLQEHQNNCNNHLDMRKLEQKLETVLQRVSTLEKKHEQDSKEMKELKLKHENELKQVKSKVTKHDEDVRGLRQELLTLRTMPMRHTHAPQAVQQPLPVNPYQYWQEPEPAYTMPMRHTHAPQAVQQPLPVNPYQYWQEPETAYTWKIENFTTKLTKAKSENDCGITESEPFYSSHGYKMMVKVCLNEGPNGFSGYMGVYFRLLKGDRDGMLPWPFTNRCIFILVDQQDDPGQRQNIERVLVPNGEVQFQRPRQRENEAFEGLADQNFVKHSTLHTRQYVRDHAVYIKVMIDP